MTTKKSRDDAYEVSDSTDWLETPLKGLAGVESALRCQVCKDFFRTPMITSCGHTFCSVCIRRCLGTDGKCPTCRALDQESKLKNNGVVEDTVEAFTKTRADVLEFARRSSTPFEQGGERRSKRKVAELENGTEDSGPSKRTRSSSRRTPQAVESPVVVDSEADDEDYEPACPICHGKMTVEQIERHIDKCTGKPPTPSVQSPLQGSISKPIVVSSKEDFTRLSQPHYGTMKDNVLKKKLLDSKLSTSGSRQMWEKRYTEWATLWNANCDAKEPRSRGEVLKDMDPWEKTQGSRAVSTRLGKMVKDKDFDGDAWSVEHQDEFKRLVANARRKKSKPSTTEAVPDTLLPGISSPTVAAGTSETPPTDVQTGEAYQMGEMPADTQPFAQRQAHNASIHYVSQALGIRPSASDRSNHVIDGATTLSSLPEQTRATLENAVPDTAPFSI